MLLPLFLRALSSRELGGMPAKQGWGWDWGQARLEVGLDDLGSWPYCVAAPQKTCLHRQDPAPIGFRVAAA